jgi:CRP/FNR family transcriptional regulator, cyclic AMP receptor protein
MQLLSSCYLFKELSESQLLRLAVITKEEQVEEGYFLMHEGQKGEALFVLKEGAVELLTTVNDDFELPIAILRNPGECTGTSSLVPPYEYSLSARCSEEAKILIIKQSNLKELLVEDHELGCIIMKNLAQHFLERLKETRQEVRIHFKTIFKSIHH